MLTQIKSNYLENGYKIGRNGKDLRRRIELNLNSLSWRLSNLSTAGLISTPLSKPFKEGLKCVNIELITINI